MRHALLVFALLIAAAPAVAQQQIPIAPGLFPEEPTDAPDEWQRLALYDAARIRELARIVAAQEERIRALEARIVYAPSPEPPAPSYYQPPARYTRANYQPPQPAAPVMYWNSVETNRRLAEAFERHVAEVMRAHGVTR